MVGASQRRSAYQIIATAHQTEAMARQKKLRELDFYLKPVTKARKKALKKPVDNSAIVAHLDRIAARRNKEAEANGG